MKKIILPAFVLGFGSAAFAQTGINTPAPKTTLDVSVQKDSNGTIDLSQTYGLQAPRLSREELTNNTATYGANQTGALIYITDVSKGNTNDQREYIDAIGYYYFDAAANRWQKVSAVTDLKSQPWKIQNTTTEATANDEDIYQMGSVAIGKNQAAEAVTLDVEGAIRGGTNHLGKVGINSVAFGSGNTVEGMNSLAVGQGIEINEYSMHSFASGSGSRIYDSYYSANLGGFNTLRNSPVSLVTGYYNVVNGANNTFVTGTGNDVREVNTTFVTGGGNTVNGADNTLVAGTGNNVETVDNSTVLGSGNQVAEVDGVLVGGTNNISANNSETVLGKYNAINTVVNNVDEAPLLQVGNGTMDNRANALTITNKGFIGTDVATNPTERLDIGSGNIRVRDINDNAGAATDKIVVANADGVLKTVTAADIVPTAAEPWQIQGTTNPATDNTDNIYQMGSVVIGKNLMDDGNLSLNVNGNTSLGDANHTFDSYLTTLIGNSNIDSSSYSHLSVGSSNMTTDLNATVVSGASNQVDESYSSNVTGNSNHVSDSYGSNVTGNSNQVEGAGDSFIIGSSNYVNDISNSLVGGISLDINSANTTYIFGDANIVHDVNSSTVFGSNNQVDEVEGVFVGGTNNISANNSETVLGKYNAINTVVNNVDEAPLLQVGNGTMDNRANALTITNKGFIGTDVATNPTERLDIGSGNIRVRDINDNAGAATDKIVVANADGVLKTVAATDIVPAATEPWQVQGGTDLATDNTDNIYQMGSVAIGKNQAAAGVALDVDGVINAEFTDTNDPDNIVFGIKTATRDNDPHTKANRIYVSDNEDLSTATLYSELRMNKFGVNIGTDNKLANERVKNDFEIYGIFEGGAMRMNSSAGDRSAAFKVSSTSYDTGVTASTGDKVGTDYVMMDLDVRPNTGITFRSNKINPNDYLNNFDAYTFPTNTPKEGQVLVGSATMGDASTVGRSLEWKNISDLVPATAANNGIEKDASSGAIQLGGVLNKATKITTTNAETLAIEGLATPTAANKMVVAENATGTLRSVTNMLYADVTANYTINTATNADYNAYVPEVYIAATIPATADIDIALPAASAANKGQKLTVVVANTTDNGNYVNVKQGTTTVAYAGLPNQTMRFVSNGTKWTRLNQ